MKEKILITGSAGFIGYHLCYRLIKENFEVIGIDNLNSYYEVSLKDSRLKILKNLSAERNKNYKFYLGDISNIDDLKNIFKLEKPTIIINLAAQAGVRYSIENPHSYATSNLQGFLNILECCRNFKIKHLLYASSSSVYGGNKKVPFSETDFVDNPVSLYAATKKSNELMAYAYSHLFRFPSTGLRFFTVYGPWGRPDMAPMIFVKSILSNQIINIYNHGLMFRDFTYIDDVIESIFRLIIKNPPDNKKDENNVPHEIFNIGNSSKVKLMDFVKEIEKACETSAKKNFLEMQDGDVVCTFADCSKLSEYIDFFPNTELSKGINELVKWYRKYYRI